MPASKISALISMEKNYADLRNLKKKKETAMEVV